MQKELTIRLDVDLYDQLHTVVGKGRISSFIEELVRPYFLKQNLDAAYAEMAQDEEGEAAALQWTETLIGETLDETW